MKTTFIYALCEPGTRTVRYIGMTKNLKSRFGQHCKRPTATLGTHLGHWLGSLRSADKKPTMIQLSEVGADAGPEEEIRYISAARMLGMDLVNSTDGGEGVTATPETREKMRVAWTLRAPISEETRARMSASQRARPSPSPCKGRAATPGQLISLEMGRKLKGKDHPRFGKPGTMLGRKHVGASSQYIGVTWGKNFNRWVARISVNGKMLALGCFLTEADAARAYDTRAILLFGSGAKLNFPI